MFEMTTNAGQVSNSLNRRLTALEKEAKKMKGVRKQVAKAQATKPQTPPEDILKEVMGKGAVDKELSKMMRANKVGK